MPVSNSTVWPSRSVTSKQRHANSSRFSPSGTSHFAQRLRGTLPNIAPPSRRWRLPSTDQSCTRSLLRLGRTGRAELQRRKPCVEWACREQLRVSADGDDTAAIHDDDAIRFEHGG